MKGFIYLGNGLSINENMVEKIENGIIYLKNGETYKMKELPRTETKYYESDLYGTKRGKYE